MTPEALIRGTYVHRATHLYDINDLDEETLDPLIRPYLDGWIKFRKDTNFTIEAIEEKVYSAKYNYAGRMDRRGIFYDKRTALDVKTGEEFNASGAIQLSAYQNGHNEMSKEKIKNRLIVQLNKDGTYKLPPKEYYGKNDFNIFLSALTIHNWRCKYGKD
jgi:hypothetical protein